MYEVYISNRVLKSIRRLPMPIQRKMVNLIEDLRDKGPIRLNWPSFSKLDSDTYHCHLAYKWAACWSFKGPEINKWCIYPVARDRQSKALEADASTMRRCRATLEWRCRSTGKWIVYLFLVPKDFVICVMLCSYL